MIFKVRDLYLTQALRDTVLPTTCASSLDVFYSSPFYSAVSMLFCDMQLIWKIESIACEIMRC